MFRICLSFIKGITESTNKSNAQTVIVFYIPSKLQGREMCHLGGATSTCDTVTVKVYFAIFFPQLCSLNSIVLDQISS